MAYGSLKVDNIIFTNGGVDQTVTVSGIVAATSGNLTVTGTISGAVVQGGTLVSGATVTGTAGQFTTLTGGTAGFTTVTGTTVTGTTANFVSGVFTTQISGATVTGNTGQFINIAAGGIGATTITGTTVTGTTANFTSGVFTTQISGATVTGTTANFTSGNFTNISGGTQTVTSGVFATGSATNPSISFTSDPNTGIYSPGADQVAISTNAVERVEFGTSEVVFNDGGENYDFRIEGDTNANLFFVDASTDRVGLGTSSPTRILDVTSAPDTTDPSNGATFAIATPGLTPTQINSTTAGLGTGGIGSNHAGDYHLRSFWGVAIDKGAGNLTGPAANTVNADTRTFAIRQYAGGTTWNTQFCVNGSGNVGIGTAAPGTLIHGQIASTASTNTEIFRLTDNALCDFRVFLDRGTALGNSATRLRTANGILTFDTSDAERARIDSSGRLLVGTSTSRYGRLQVEGITDEGSNVFITRNTNDGAQPLIALSKSRGTTLGSNTVVASGDIVGELRFLGADGTSLVRAAAIQAVVDGTPGANDMPGRLVFSTTADGASSPTERMRISQSGEVGIGMLSAATVRLAVASGSSYIFIGRNSAGSTDQIRIEADGDVENVNNTYRALSDFNLKENIVDANSQWDDLKALRVRKFNFKEETGYQTHTQIGLIAQEVELVSPGLVSESPDRDEDGNDLGTVTKSVNYSVLYMKAVKALQEAMERIETLEADVAALKAQ